MVLSSFNTAYGSALVSSAHSVVGIRADNNKNNVDNIVFISLSWFLEKHLCHPLLREEDTNAELIHIG
jgi:hypothetical protein